MKSFTADLDGLPTLPDVGFGFSFQFALMYLFCFLSDSEFVWVYMCVFVREGEIEGKNSSTRFTTFSALVSYNRHIVQKSTKKSSLNNSDACILVRFTFPWKISFTVCVFVTVSFDKKSHAVATWEACKLCFSIFFCSMIKISFQRFCDGGVKYGKYKLCNNVQERFDFGFA